MRNNHNKGFIRLIVLILIFLMAASYFKISFRELFNSDINDGNVSFIWSTIQNIWASYIKTPVIFLLHAILGIIQ